MENYELNELSNLIIGAAIEVHRKLGPGLFERVYRDAMLLELKLRNIRAASEVILTCEYKGYDLGVAYRADIIVEDEIILELKATDNNNPVFWKQLKTYLRISGKKLGLLINFNKVLLKDGLERVVNDFEDC